MDPKAGFFFVELGFRYSELGATVVASNVTPEFAVDTPGSFQVPGGVDEFLNEDALMRVSRLVSLHEFRVEAVVFFLEIGFGGHKCLPTPLISRRPKEFGSSFMEISLNSEI
jgi:hypothetical protein